MKLNKAAPDLAESIYHALLRYRSPFLQLPQLTTSVELQDALMHQIHQGWDTLLFGTPSPHLIHYQTMHLQSLGSKINGTTWFSRLITQIWFMLRRLWTNRNEHIHDKVSGQHPTDMKFIRNCIRKEHAIGMGPLPSNHSYLFSYTLSQLLRLRPNDQLLWICSVWLARDHFLALQDLDPWEKCEKTRKILLSIKYSKYHRNTICDNILNTS